MANSLGDLILRIGGDTDPLKESLQEIPELARETATALEGTIGDGLTAAEAGMRAVQQASSESFSQVATESTTAADSLQQFGVQATDAGQAASESADRDEQMLEALRNIAASSQDTAEGMRRLEDAEHESAAETEHLAQVLETAKEGLIKIAEVLGVGIGLEELAKDALEAYAAVQKAEIALTALTGSAEHAQERIEQLKELSLTDALSFPALVQAEQRMTAFGFSAEQIPAALQGAADAAAATDTSFDTVMSAIDRLALSGNAGARQLASLGLSVEDLATVMNVSTAKVKDAFKGLDQADRLQVMIDALKKYEGTSQAVAESVAGQWVILKNKIDFALEELGATLAPLATELMHDLELILPPAEEVLGLLTSIAGVQMQEMVAAIKELYAAVSDLLGPVRDLFNSFGGFDWPKIAGELINQATHLRDIRDAALAAAAAIDVWKGKYPDFTTAYLALESAVQKTAKTTEDYTAAANRAGVQTDKLVAAHANAALAAAEHEKHTRGVHVALDDLYPALDRTSAALNRLEAEQNIANDKYRDAIAVYALAASKAGESSQVITAALDAVNTAAHSAGVSQQQLAKDLDAARGGMGGVGITTRDVTVPALDECLSVAGELTDQIRILTGSAKDQSDALSNLADHWVFQNGQWEKAVDLLGQVQGAMGAVTQAADQTAAAIEADSEAVDSLSTSAGKVGKAGSAGGGRGGSYGAGDILGIYAAAGASNAELEGIGRALGLIEVGQRQFITVDEENAILKAANANYHYEQTVNGLTVVFDKAVEKTTAASTAVSTFAKSVETVTAAAAPAAPSLDQVVASLEDAYASTDAILEQISDLENAGDTGSDTLRQLEAELARANGRVDSLRTEVLGLGGSIATTSTAIATAAAGFDEASSSVMSGVNALALVAPAIETNVVDPIMSAIQSLSSIAPPSAPPSAAVSPGPARFAMVGSQPLATLGTPLGGTVLNPLGSVTVYITGNVYGPQAAYMIGQELTNALQQVASQNRF